MCFFSIKEIIRFVEILSIKYLSIHFHKVASYSSHYEFIQVALANDYHGAIMREVIVMFFVGLGYLLQIIGGFALIGIFFYGIYTFFATSIAIGLMMIGGAVVGGWIVRIVSVLLIAMGAGAAVIGARNE